jgi:hypothetical protein
MPHAKKIFSRATLGTRATGSLVLSHRLCCEISGSHVYKYKMTVVWDVARCSLVETDRRFRGAYCLHHRPEDNHLHRLCSICNAYASYSAYLSSFPLLILNLLNI